MLVSLLPRPRLGWPLALFAILPACTPPDTSYGPSPDDLSQVQKPLIGGEITEEYQGVAALQFSTQGIFCTATLISPRVVLTAAHCVDMFSQDPNALAFFGTNAQGGGGTRVPANKRIQHNGWTGSLENGHDIAMMRLAFPQPPEWIIPIRKEPIDSYVGQPYRQVGFGVYDHDGTSSDGKKRAGLTTITKLTSGDVIQSGDELLSVCFGDSGGPGMVMEDGVEVVAGVHSYTQGDNCNPPNGDTRVDLYAEDFVLPWIQENDPTCGKDWLCAKIGCENDPDCEPCGPEGTCTENCELPDPDCETSTLGEICQTNSQCDTGQCVFWTGDFDFHFCSRSCDAGNPCPGDMVCEVVGSLGQICTFDSDPPGIIGDDCEKPTDCGSYICEQGKCVTSCNLALDEGCPPQFECTTLDGMNDYCHSIATPEEGCGCQAPTSPATLLSVGLLLGVLGLGFRRRSSRTSGGLLIVMLLAVSALGTGCSKSKPNSEEKNASGNQTGTDTSGEKPQAGKTFLVANYVLNSRTTGGVREVAENGATMRLLSAAPAQTPYIAKDGNVYFVSPLNKELAEPALQFDVWSLSPQSGEQKLVGTIPSHCLLGKDLASELALLGVLVTDKAVCVEFQAAADKNQQPSSHFVELPLTGGTAAEQKELATCNPKACAEPPAPASKATPPAGNYPYLLQVDTQNGALALVGKDAKGAATTVPIEGGFLADVAGEGASPQGQWQLFFQVDVVQLPTKSKKPEDQIIVPEYWFPFLLDRATGQVFPILPNIKWPAAITNLNEADTMYWHNMIAPNFKWVSDQTLVIENLLVRIGKDVTDLGGVIISNQ